MVNRTSEDTSRLIYLAGLCNENRVFIDNKWNETPESILELMSSSAYQEVIKNFKGLALSDGHVVSALFHARQAEVKKKRARQK